jgi:seryl-tRNA synthetase
MTEEVKELSQEELRKALTAMHHGLLNMQERLDDHEKVLEKLMLVMQNLTAGQVPDGFRQPKKVN